jgi:hypothetical protein
MKGFITFEEKYKLSEIPSLRLLNFLHECIL